MPLAPSRRLLLSAAALLLSFTQAAHAADQNVWDAAYDAGAKTRYIPVELWTGSQWDGSRELKMLPADLQFSDHKHINGPFPYTPHGATAPVMVYQRVNRGKVQFFTLSSRGDGLGRVYDSRFEDRDCVDEVKMPLGLWHENETRVITFPCKQGARQSEVVLTIEKLDFEYHGVPHSLQFHWVHDGGRGKANDMH